MVTACRVAALLLVFSSLAIQDARARDQIIGRWFVSAEEDRFGDGGRYTASTISDSMAFVVRCLEKQMSVAFLHIARSSDALTPGEKFKVKLRVDKLPIVDVTAAALNEKLIQAVPDKAMVVAIRDGKELAARIENELGVHISFVFKLDQAKKAFAIVLKECPID